MANAAIAIDGPVASGKSSVGRRVAAALQWPFIDTGTMYRAVTWAALQRGVAVQDDRALEGLVNAIELRVLTPEPDGHEAARVLVDGEDATPFLRSPAVENGVSIVSAVPAVRRRMVALQRAAAVNPVVMAGRDIGTIVLPDAPLKIYIDACATTRAARRAEELARRAEPRPYERVLTETTERDRIDSERTDSPLSRAADAVWIDSDHLSEAEVAEMILDLARRRFGVEV